jgi:Flp pilus assembly protein TadD
LYGVLVLALSGTSALADGDGGDGDNDSRWQSSKLRPVQEAIEQGDFNAALEKLDALYQQDPKDPDVLNLLGYSYRQLGDIDSALHHYQAALSVAPRHKGANEYLGELYLQSGQLHKAEERLAVLDKACFFGCKQYYELEDAIEAYKKKNGVK